MTVSYTRDVMTSGLLTFNKLLLKWKGSVWKNVWRELYIWMFLYLTISGVYRFKLRDTEQGEWFEDFVVFCDKFAPDASLMFILGFYVTYVANRWWAVYQRIPWPDSTAMCIATFLKSRPGERSLEKDRKIRRTMVRYLLLAFVLVFRDISESVKLRFPTLQHLVEYNLLTDEELLKLNGISVSKTTLCKYWVPMQWICTILRTCHEKDKIPETHMIYLVELVLTYRTKLNDLLSYDWVGIPLVYTQVVNLAVLAYFAVCLFSRQFIGTNRFPVEETKWEQDYVIPFFTIVQFILYVGWLKVAQMMINPFGMDDDDFECNYLIERHQKISNIIVDQMYGDLPKLVDTFDDLLQELPHTVASRKFENHPMVGSVAKMNVPTRQQRVLSKETLAEYGGSIRRRLNSAESRSDEGSIPMLTPRIANSGTGVAIRQVLSSDGQMIQSPLKKSPAGVRSTSTANHKPESLDLTTIRMTVNQSPKPSPALSESDTPLVSGSTAAVSSTTQAHSIVSEVTQVPSTLSLVTQLSSTRSSTTQEVTSEVSHGTQRSEVLQRMQRSTSSEDGDSQQSFE